MKEERNEVGKGGDKVVVVLVTDALVTRLGR